MSVGADEKFDQLWRDHAPAVLRYTRRRVGADDVDDVVAETFVVAWRRLGEVPPRELPWLLGVARGVIANLRRAGRRRDALQGRVAGHARDDAAGPAWAEEPGGAVAALGRLPAADQELLTLIAWDGLSPAEAAAALGCSYGAVKVRLHRARRRFKALVSTYETDPAAQPSVVPAARPDLTGGAS